MHLLLLYTIITLIIAIMVIITTNIFFNSHLIKVNRKLIILPLYVCAEKSNIFHNITASGLLMHDEFMVE